MSRLAWRRRRYRSGHIPCCSDCRQAANLPPRISQKRPSDATAQAAIRLGTRAKGVSDQGIMGYEIWCGIIPCSVLWWWLKVWCCERRGRVEDDLSTCIFEELTCSALPASPSGWKRACASKTAQIDDPHLIRHCARMQLQIGSTRWRTCQARGLCIWKHQTKKVSWIEAVFLLPRYCLSWASFSL